MSKGVAISSQVSIFAVSAVLAAGIFGGALNILENNSVQEKLTEYRAEEFATSLGVITQYGEERSVVVEKRFRETYEIGFDDSSGFENMTMTKSNGTPITVFVEVPTVLDLPSKTVESDTICINKTRNTPSSSEEVKINEGSC